ncbi:unannotated protein [freshwater metagenome]|uniref:Unannotated protein n=1 Tax=freshwater metagenome TaxID=449393 RepID=A0A6J5YIN1_9ZZZZ
MVHVYPAVVHERASGTPAEVAVAVYEVTSAHGAQTEFHDTETERDPAVTSGTEGAAGSRAGTMNSEASEGSLSPTSLIATTWKI